MATVKLVNVVKRFGDVIAVNKVSFEVRHGEFFALLGPSGCGKTTTLRLIAGLEEPDEGEIYIDGRVVNNLHPKDRDVAMVFQNYALYPHMKVYDNIAFPLRVRKKELGLTNEDIRQAVLRVAKMLKIEELLDRYPSQLSGGQQQRVALARALVRKPKVWLLDEPLSNLDAKLRLMMRAELKRLQRELGITTIYVTHDQAEATSMADRIAVMNEGRILQIGRPEELYLRPRNIFVATFIGSPPANVIECHAEKSVEGEVKIVCPGFTHELAGDVADHIARSIRGDLLILAIRPEFVKVSRELSESTPYRARVLISEFMGSEQVVTAELGGQAIKAKVREEARLEPGQEVFLGWDWGKVLFFDGKTGEALV